MKRKRGNKKIFRLLWKLLKRYIANCNIHGVRHLVADDRHWTERLFWIFACGISWYGCIVMIWGVVEDFDNRRVAVTVDTNHLNFVPGFAAVHVCTKFPPAAMNLATKIWSKSAAGKVLNTRGIASVVPLAEPTDSEAFTRISDAMYLNCSEVFESCIWDNKPIDCCEAFRPIRTPEVTCLSTNSIYTRHSKGINQYDHRTFHIRPTGKRRLLKIRFQDNQMWKTAKKNFVIYITGNMELPLKTTGTDQKLSSAWKSHVQIIDISQKPTYNQEAVYDVPIEKRRCRFAGENEGLELYPVYGNDACATEKLLLYWYEVCECMAHHYPRMSWMKVCSNDQLNCFRDIGKNISMPEFTECLADCIETGFNFFMNDAEGEAGLGININMLPGPMKKYVRYVVSTKLDLMVGVGSALGLFVGASILSLVEIPYWFIVRSIDDNDPDDADPEDHLDNREAY